MQSVYVILATFLLSECVITVIGAANANQMQSEPAIARLAGMPIDAGFVLQFIIFYLSLFYSS